ncbi:hypothetical protein [Marininema halotolerans]|uniref:Uncharacterized protein n=1 Tax=Marininema halotolerans TaxID=1155944 RepID=A0A1I6SHV9_9BACL|nr:hypothetical protein [Marininema halotolerans]SFS76494.1 hypothetical protein SAMN05444972_107101 [Marininema halotolerans]
MKNINNIFSGFLIIILGLICIFLFGIWLDFILIFSSVLIIIIYLIKEKKYLKINLKYIVVGLWIILSIYFLAWGFGICLDFNNPRFIWDFGLWVYLKNSFRGLFSYNGILLSILMLPHFCLSLYFFSFLKNKK